MPVVVRDLAKGYSGTTLFTGLNHTFPDGATTAVMGPSGCGKSTLMAIIAGYEEPDEGEVVCEGAGPRVGFIFQTGLHFTARSTRDNIALAALQLGVPWEAACDRADALLSDLHLIHLSDVPVRRLSGGERQRVAILRVLAYRPTIILADEPTASLDVANRDHVTSSLNYAADAGACVILTTHDEDVAQACHQTLRLR